jgi:hypothetical protein
VPFKGSIQLFNKVGEDLPAEQVGLVIASLLFTRRIGGRRSRGWGRCKFEIEAFQQDSSAYQALQTWLECC